MAELLTGRKDFLTSCFTREEFGDFMDKVFIESKMYQKPFSLLLVDVDKFKNFNDKFGHLCGDEVLKYFSSTLRLSLEDVEHFPFRYGGDEFVVVFPQKSSAETYTLATKVSRNMKKRRLLLKGRLFKMAFSGGVASYPADADSVESLIDKADKAMYFSKKHCPGKATQYSKIWFRRFEEVIGIVFVILLFLAIVFGRNFNFKNQLGKIKSYGTIGKIEKAPRSLPATSSSKQKPDRIHLKSGDIMEGIIVREGTNEVELKLQFDKGEGSFVLPRSDIESIERGSNSSR